MQNSPSPAIGSESKPPSSRYARKVLAASVVGYAMDGFDMLILGFMLPEISDELHPVLHLHGRDGRENVPRWLADVRRLDSRGLERSGRVGDYRVGVTASRVGSSDERRRGEKPALGHRDDLGLFAEPQGSHALRRLSVRGFAPNELPRGIDGQALQWAGEGNREVLVRGRG